MTDPIPHPLESIFDIEAGSTPTPLTSAAALVSNEILDPSTGEVISRKTSGISSDDLAKEERIEDLKIDTQIDVIHGAALEAFEAQSRIAQEADPRFAARNAEVAAQYLKIALDAVNSRVDSKYKRAKIRHAAIGEQKTVNNNILVADRNDLLRTLLQQNEKIIEPLEPVHEVK